jgi:hypothetical protein
MKSLAHRAPVCLYVLVLVLSSCVGLRAQSEDRGSRPLQMASLHSALVWQRTSPTVQKPEGPVLYQILFRSSAKPGFVPKIDGSFTLTTTWNYKSQAASIRHIGPMAQDFHAAFQVGEDDKHITEIDEGGVAFAAIQGLNQKLENNIEQLHAQLKNKDAQISAQQKQIEALEQQVRAMMTRVEAVEKTSQKNARARRKLNPFGSVIGL